MSDTNAGPYTVHPWAADKYMVNGPRGTVDVFDSKIRAENIRTALDAAYAAGAASSADVLREVREVMTQALNVLGVDPEYAPNTVAMLRAALAKLPEAPPASSPRA